MEILENNEPVKENQGTLHLIISVFLVILCFFILMNSISTQNTQKSIDISRSLTNEFHNKDLKQKVQMFDKRKYEQKTGDSSVGFKDIISTFLDAQSKNALATISDSKSNYIINVRINSFFAPNSTDIRPAGEAFIRSLNRYIETYRKNPAYIAKVVLFYNNKNKQFADQAIENLHSVLDYESKRNISFSVMPAKNNASKEDLEKLYILFDKNEF